MQNKSPFLIMMGWGKSHSLFLEGRYKLRVIGLILCDIK